MTVRAATLGQVVCIVCCIISDVTNKASRWRFFVCYKPTFSCSCVKLRNLTISILFLKLFIGYHHYLLQFHFWNSPSVSV